MIHYLNTLDFAQDGLDALAAEGSTVLISGGTTTETMLPFLDFHVDNAFCGVIGIDARAGVFGADTNEVTTDGRRLASAQRLVVLAGSSKFSRRGPVRLADVDQIDTLITDDGAPEGDVDPILARNVDVVVCA